MLKVAARGQESAHGDRVTEASPLGPVSGSRQPPEERHVSRGHSVRYPAEVLGIMLTEDRASRDGEAHPGIKSARG
jgi:hypothetical protein